MNGNSHFNQLPLKIQQKSNVKFYGNPITISMKIPIEIHTKSCQNTVEIPQRFNDNPIIMPMKTQKEIK